RDLPWVKALWSVIENASISAAPKDESLDLLDARGNPSEALEGKGDGPTAARMLLRAARRTMATDIHVEPKNEDNAQIRMRVDGQMIWVAEMPKKSYELAAGLVKTACEMKQAARDSIQEGHFTSRFNGKRVEYRVSFTPSVYGQKMVIRVLDQFNVPTSLGDLGLIGYMRDKLESVTQLDAGMLLVCGPTGSGKTTTLYNGLREIDRDSRNVITIEDPVEYQLEGVTQMPVDERTGKGFSNLLRSVLRQDPDVILLGEIRDEDTARTAMQAAMTGHLVFSTVHSKDTVSAVYRLLDLKVEPYLVANSVSLLLAQRLVRQLCPTCARDVPVTPGLVNRMGRYGRGVTKVKAAVGCKHCLKTGYRGRHGLFELLEVTDELRDVILGEASIQAMRKAISNNHFTTLGEFGWKLVSEGITSVEEVERVAGAG
ncbi:MAG: GspE/PulE family protein, partial [Planctomycetota bacterium]